MAAGESSRVQEAQQIAKTDPRKAEETYKDIVSKAPSAGSDAATREYEQALISLGELYTNEKYDDLWLATASPDKANVWDPGKHNN
jgi:26S proteasome regulatory subunit N6